MDLSERERTDIEGILDFWFGEPDSPEFGTNRDEWWVQSDDFDARIRQTMLPLHDRAITGELDDWVKNPGAGLVLIILLDQVPRNMFRGTARAFAGDSHARSIARQYIERGHDGHMADVHRLFAYLPFEHSENMDDQDRSVDLMSGLTITGVMESALRHREIIGLFGRFPHRNVQLGRISTPGEIEFLKQPNSSF